MITSNTWYRTVVFEEIVIVKAFCSLSLSFSLEVCIKPIFKYVNLFEIRKDKVFNYVF